MNNMTREEAMKLAEEVFNEEYSGLDKDSFLIGFREAYNALTALYKDKFELVRRMREAQDVANRAMVESDDYSEALVYVDKANELEKEVDEYLKKM